MATPDFATLTPVEDDSTPPAKVPDFASLEPDVPKAPKLPDFKTLQPETPELDLSQPKVPTDSMERAATNFAAESKFKADAISKATWGVPENRKPEDNSYHISDGQVLFDSANMAKGLREAVADGVVDRAQGEKLMPQFQNGDEQYAKVQELKKAAIGNQKLQAVLHGTTLGASFLAGAGPGAAGGAGLATFVGFPEAAPVTAPIGGLITGSIAAYGANKALKTLGKYNDFIKSVNASAELNPVYDSAGQLVAFGTSAPKSVANLVKLGRTAQMARIVDSTAPSATRVVAGQVAKGAAAGAIYAGALQPAFTVGLKTLGLEDKDAPVAPSAQSLLSNVAIGAFLSGHGLGFKDYSSAEVGNIIARGKVREDAGIPFDLSDPVTVHQAFAQRNPNSTLDYNKSGLLDPLTTDEQAVYRAIKQQIMDVGPAAAAEGLTPTEFLARQAKIPSFLNRGGAVITTAGMKLGKAQPTTEQGGNYGSLRELGSGEVFQREPETTGEKGDLSGRVEPGEQGEEAAPIQPTVPVEEQAATGPVNAGEVAPQTPVANPVTKLMQGVDFANMKLASTVGVKAGLTLTPTEIPMVQAEQTRAKQDAANAIAKENDAGFQEAYGRQVWLSGVLEGINRKGPNYDAMQQTPRPESVTPAITYKKRVYRLAEGEENHNDIIARVRSELGIPKSKRLVGVKRGFILPDGTFSPDREKAAKIALVPTTVEPGKLHSEDLVKAESGFPKLVSQQQKNGPVWGVQTSADHVAWTGSKGSAEKWLSDYQFKGAGLKPTPPTKTPEVSSKLAVESAPLKPSDIGYRSDKAFQRDYTKNGLKEHGETETEFMMRRHCGGGVPKAKTKALE